MTITSFTLAGPIGTDAISVSIQCSIDATKLPAFHVEGVTTVQAKEIAVRVRSAIVAADLCAWPAGRVTISIDAKGSKIVGSSALDLPIALAIAGIDVGGLLVVGELGLDGSIRPVRGTLQAALLAETLGMPGVLVPAKSTREVMEAVGSATVVRSITKLSEIEAALATSVQLAPKTTRARDALDFVDVCGQGEAVSKVEQAVQSRTGLLLIGSPGAGKTMIARRIPSLLSSMSRVEQIEVTRIYSALGLSDGLVTERPFRAPHHTISAAAMVGGGMSPRPGEVQLASHGVLFLDELCEFSRGTIEALAHALDRMPAASSRPLVVASTNTCPCGYQGSAVRACSCTTEAITRYADRIAWTAGKLGLSIRAEVQPISLTDMREFAGESSASIAARIAATM